MSKPDPRVASTAAPTRRRALDSRGYSSELRLVGACLAWPRTPARADALRTLSRDGVDWVRVVQLVHRHRVAGLVYNALLHAGVEPDASVAKVLMRSAQDAAFEELRLASELRRLLAALREDDVEAVVLKGLSAAVQGFGRIGLRQNRDIDLLFRPEDVPAVVRRLRWEGYEQVEPEALLTAAGLTDRIRTHKDIVFQHPGRRTVVEVHWRMFDNKEFAGSMEDVTPVEIAVPTGGEIRALAPPAAMLFMSGHGAQHAWSRLKWLADFAAYCATLGTEDVERLYQRARSGGLGLAMGQGLLLAGELMDVPIPASLSRDVASNWRLRVLRRVGRRALGSEEEIVELEDRVFGSTLKTLSHYLLSRRLAYLLAQLVLDASEPPSAQASTVARRLGPFAKAPLWIYDRLKMARRR